MILPFFKNYLVVISMSIQHFNFFSACDYLTTKSEEQDNSIKIDKLLNDVNKDPAVVFSDAESLTSNGIDCWDDEM